MITKAVSRRTWCVVSSLWWMGNALGANFEFHLSDALGRAHSEAELARHKATVFVFLATDCPNSNSYAPELARLQRDYESRGVVFYSVYSDPAETDASVRKHDGDYAIPFAALLDPKQTLARETHARVTPEAVVMSPDARELYHGRIDDRFANFGQTRVQSQKNDLRAALDAVLAGKPVEHPYEPSLGCAIPGVNQ